MTTMLHPFNGNECDVIDLKPGEQIQAGDIYRSATIIEEKSGLGRWFVVSPVADGSVIGPECNVHFLRLKPKVSSEDLNREIFAIETPEVANHGIE